MPGRSDERRHLFTSESVTEGHPDKICDQVSDAVLDALYEQDPWARVACETATTTGMVFVMGEISTQARVDITQVVRDTIRSIGYDQPAYGFDGSTCAVVTALGEQSPDIAQGVDHALDVGADGSFAEDEAIGAGDQGLMFGYATDETESLMPLPISLAHALARRLAQVRKERLVDYLRPDGKTQVTVEYDGVRPVRVHTVVVSTQHDPDIGSERIHDDVRKAVVEPVLGNDWIDDATRILVNPTGRFVIGGPQGDAGLTGRKVIADTYGGMGRHGGGAFSGKDPTKVDRSGAYAARYVAKNVVAAGLASRCEVQVAYCIGVARPVSLLVDTFGTGRIPDRAIEDLIRRYVDLRPAAIIRHFNLRRPIYRPTAAYGHFGRTDIDLPWERTDLADRLQAQAGQEAQAVDRG